MGLLSRFRSESGEQERPPKPEGESIEHSHTLTWCEYTFTYQNGETEVVEGHSLELDNGVYQVKGDDIKPRLYAWSSGTAVEVPVDVLSARPAETPIGEFVVEWEEAQEYEWDRVLNAWQPRTVPRVTILKTDVIEGDVVDDG